MRHIFFRILAGLVLIAAIAGIAFLAYSAGITHGQAITPQAPAGQTNGQVYPVFGFPFWWPFPFFGIFGLLAGIFLLFLAFGAFRRLLWGPRFGWHRMYGRFGRWGYGDQGDEIPPYLAELHRRMHAADEEKPADQPSQKQA